MQIKAVHKLQNALDASMKVITFAWRHLLTLIVVGMIVAAFIIGKISWINSLYFYVGAVFFNWFKMQFKATKGNCNLAQEQMFESAKWSRLTQMGSAWDPYAPGSSEYYIRQTRYY